jgi:hypothetical protein
MFLPITFEEGNLIFFKNKSLIKALTILPYGISRVGRFTKISPPPSEAEAEEEEEEEKTLNLPDFVLKKYREVCDQNAARPIPNIVKCSVSDFEKIFEIFHRNLLQKKKDLLANLYYSMAEMYSPNLNLDVINAYFKKELDQVQITNKKNSCVSLCEKRGGKKCCIQIF